MCAEKERKSDGGSDAGRYLTICIEISSHDCPLPLPEKSCIIVTSSIGRKKYTKSTQAMMNKECISCKRDDDTKHQSAVKNIGCEASYLCVDACMKLNNGRVSACTEEWEEFRKCFEQGKAASESGAKNQRDH
ncbi:hypothetical protein Plhal703r1_c53g0159131 [Plasmopara halstedii]